MGISGCAAQLPEKAVLFPSLCFWGFGVSLFMIHCNLRSKRMNHPCVSIYIYYDFARQTWADWESLTVDSAFLCLETRGQDLIFCQASGPPCTKFHPELLRPFRFLTPWMKIMLRFPSVYLWAFHLWFNKPQPEIFEGLERRPSSGKHFLLLQRTKIQILELTLLAHNLPLLQF